MYKITQVSKILGVSIHTLRYYEKEGLTPFIKRENGNRVYSEDDIKFIKLIICLRSIDMPIKNIKEYMQLYMEGNKTIEERRNLMRQYCEFVEKKITTTIEAMKFAAETISHYDKDVEDILANC